MHRHFVLLSRNTINWNMMTSILVIVTAYTSAGVLLGFSYAGLSHILRSIVWPSKDNEGNSPCQVSSLFGSLSFTRTFNENRGKWFLFHVCIYNLIMAWEGMCHFPRMQHEQCVTDIGGIIAEQTKNATSWWWRILTARVYYVACVFSSGYTSGLITWL